MNTRNLRTALIAPKIGLGVFVAISAIWYAGRVSAFQDSEDMPVPFGLAQGQTARLNILNTAAERGHLLTWRFLDGMGRELAQSEGRILIQSGQFMSFDVDGDSLDMIRDRFGRIQMRAVVTALGGPDTKNLRVSLEILDNATGKTSFVIIPPPDPD